MREPAKVVFLENQYVVIVDESTGTPGEFTASFRDGVFAGPGTSPKNSLLKLASRLEILAKELREKADL